MIVEELVSIVALHAPCGFLDESHLLRRGLTDLHRPPEGWPGHDVWNCRVTGDARGLHLARAELLGLSEPDLHPLVQVSRSALSIPASGCSPIIWRSSLASSDGE